MRIAFALFATAATVLVVLSASQAKALTEVRDGHLYAGDQRVRLWGVHLGPGLSVVKKERAGALVSRIKAMGFNSICIWGVRELFQEGVPEYVQGDGSGMDNFDYLIAQCKEAGMHVWLAALVRMPQARPEDYAILPPESAKDGRAWMEALQSEPADRQQARARYYLPYVDERLAALRIKFIQDLLGHVNPYTGNSYASEDAIVMLYLHDEKGLALNIGAWAVARQWPPYFQRKLQARWNGWLAGRYDDDEALREAWGGLRDGERLAEGTVAASGGEGRRGSDWMQFTLELEESHHLKLVEACRELTSLPIASDTCGYVRLWPIHSCLQGDVFAAGAYRTNWQAESQLLNKPPSFLIEKHGEGLEMRLAGRPWIIYTIFGTAPAMEFRVEHPMRVAAYAGWQDADGVFWYNWAQELTDEGYASAPIHEVNRRGTTCITTDEICLSQMRAAADLFTGGYIRPAAEPVTFTFGRRALLSSAFGGGWFRHPSYASFVKTSYLRGARVALEPGWDGEMRVEGEPVAGELPDLLSPSEQLTWDFGNGRLMVDTPEAKAFVGFPDESRSIAFNGGVTVEDISRDFVAFSLVSEDGRPIAQSAQVLLSAVSRSHNTGYEFDAEQGIVNEGTAPVVVERVACKLTLHHRAGRQVRKLDFALHTIATEAAEDGVVLREQEPVFVALLEGETR